MGLVCEDVLRTCCDCRSCLLHPQTAALGMEIWDHFLGSSFPNPTKLAAQIILVRWSLGLCCG